MDNKKNLIAKLLKPLIGFLVLMLAFEIILWFPEYTGCHDHTDHRHRRYLRTADLFYPFAPAPFLSRYPW